MREKMNNKPYIYFDEDCYEEYPTLPEKVNAFKIDMQDSIYVEIPRLSTVLERLEKNGFEFHLHYFDDFDFEGQKEEEKAFYECSMEYLELKELAEEFLKEGSENHDHLNILDMVNKIFSYYPKDEYEKVCSMYHRLYKH